MDALPAIEAGVGYTTFPNIRLKGKSSGRSLSTHTPHHTKSDFIRFTKIGNWVKGEGNLTVIFILFLSLKYLRLFNCCIFQSTLDNLVRNKSFHQQLIPSNHS